MQIRLMTIGVFAWALTFTLVMAAVWGAPQHNPWMVSVGMAVTMRGLLQGPPPFAPVSGAAFAGGSTGGGDLATATIAGRKSRPELM